MHQHGYIGRKMRIPRLKDRPAIILSTFGTSSRAKPPLDIFEEAVEQQFPEHEKFWAYSSDIICRKEKLPGLQETLARVEAAGFRKAVVQPLHIFPGTEYQHMAETCEYFPGLRVFLSETLFHRWEFAREVLTVLESDFLSPGEGLNLLALHGTPLTADPVNSGYLGMAQLAHDLYPNVLAASLEGVPDQQAMLARVRAQKLGERYRKVKILPVMYIAGMHAEQDLMGETDSWRAALEEMGFQVQCSMAEYKGSDYFKGLAYYPEVIDAFIKRLQRSLELAGLY